MAEAAKLHPVRTAAAVAKHPVKSAKIAAHAFNPRDLLRK